jgi:glucokinase
MIVRQNKGKQILALDLGGTKIRSAIVLSSGEIVSSARYPTQAAKGPEKVIERLTYAIKDTLQRVGFKIEDLNGIVIASAGIIDIINGIVTASPSLPGWRDIPLRNIIGKKLKTEVQLINDASAAALGEHRFGAGKGLNNLVYLTVSTGIGGGIIINRELYDGTDGCAAEIGHMIIEADGPKCNCGSSGCLEVMASGTAIAREAQRRIAQGQRSSLIDFTKNSTSIITAETVAEAAKCGDTVACEVINRAAYYLGIGIANVVNIFNPEMVIIGGGVSKMGELLLKPARKVVKQKAFRLPAGTVRIVRSRLGDNAGIMGAAINIFEKC